MKTAGKTLEKLINTGIHVLEMIRIHKLWPYKYNFRKIVQQIKSNSFKELNMLWKQIWILNSTWWKISIVLVKRGNVRVCRYTHKLHST